MNDGKGGFSGGSVDQDFTYIASPYTHKDPLVRAQRYQRAAEVVVYLGRCGIMAYSPIVHWHEVAKTFGLAPDEAWLYTHGLVMLRAAKATSVLMLEGWARSTGVKAEIAETIRLNKTLNYIAGEGLAETAVTINPDQPKSPAS